MKINKIEIDPTRFVELNFDLIKENRLRIPSNLEGAVVRVNVTARKGDFTQSKLDTLLQRIAKQKPSKLFLGTLKTLTDSAQHAEKAISTKLSRKQLVQEYVKRFAPEKMRERAEEVGLKILEEV